MRTPYYDRRALVANRILAHGGWCTFADLANDFEEQEWRAHLASLAYEGWSYTISRNDDRVELFREPVVA